MKRASKSKGVVQEFLRAVVALSLAVFLGAGAAGLGSAFAQHAENVCPADYSVFETLCLREETGDVVNQTRLNEAANAFFSTVTASGLLPETCVLRDLATFILIERHGNDQSWPAEALADAFFSLLKARRVCQDGRVAEAIAIYAALEAKFAN